MTNLRQDAGAHDVQPHIRNGYVEVRVLLRLRETLPIPSGTACRVVPKLSDLSLPPEITPGPAASETEPLPFTDDWRMSALHFRLLKLNQQISVQTVGEETLAVAAAVWPGSQESIEEGRAAGDFASEGQGIIQYAELSTRWSVTLGCEQCRVAALDRTMAAADSTLASFVDNLTFVIPFPYAPLLTPAIENSTLAWIREFSLDDALQADHGILPALQNDPRVPLMEQLSSLHFEPSQIEAVHWIIQSQNNRLEVVGYMKFMAAAYRALYIDSNPSTAVILAAQACETLLDLVLLHLLWWDRESPDEAGRLLADGIVKRVQSHYTRMGGTWDLASAPKLLAWRRSVADKRNRVAHGGQQASIGEALAALEAARELYFHLRAAASWESARAKYPALAGILDLSTVETGTNNQRRSIRDYVEGPDRLSWSFKYYRALANRARWAANGNPIAPSLDQPQLWITVYRDSEDVNWHFYDPEAHSVMRASDPELDPAIRRHMLEHYQQQIRPALNVDSFVVDTDYLPSPVEGAEWEDALAALPHLNAERP